MKRVEQPDAVTKDTCLWLLAGAEEGGYSGADPGETHGLSPLLSRETGRTEISLSCAAMWFRQEQIIRTVLERIAAEGISVWAVKGFDLAGSVYPFPGGRPMCDADLFIREEDRQKIMGIFQRAGWSKGSPGDGVFTSGIVSEMKMFKQGVMAELHTHIFYFPATFPGKLPTDLFENGRLLEPGLMGFAWHNALLLVIIHLLTNVSIRPVWWVDVCLLCRKVSESGTWNEFAHNASGTQLGHAISGILETASSDLKAPVPEETVEALFNCNSEREVILDQLKQGKKIPTLMNLKHLRGWKKVSWACALSWLILTGKQPLKKE
ncbi:MAG: nucleotidyltransferase family protein [Candidatus Sabulitectum sp.]|nr:nucleotidyltransferase family protein [Candidatus Sabulitectum sp.]